jgi:hypothetical protein
VNPVIKSTAAITRLRSRRLRFMGSRRCYRLELCRGAALFPKE